MTCANKWRNLDIDILQVHVQDCLYALAISKHKQPAQTAYHLSSTCHELCNYLNIECISLHSYSDGVDRVALDKLIITTLTIY